MVIPTFPDFCPLAIDDKTDYEELISEYPPFSDLAFATLHIWWNLDGKLGLSSINQNLVLNYSLPFDPKNSGLSLIGKTSVDQSIEQIFAYLREQHQAQKLVHVPEFVVNEIKNQGGLLIKEEADYHEYILDSRQIASLEGHEHSRTRRKVNRFLRETDDRDIEIKQLDLGDPDIKNLIINSIEEWRPERMAESDPNIIEMKAMNQTLSHWRHLETQNLALFIDGQLKGIVLYHPSHDKKHYIMTHLKVDYSLPHVFDYLTQVIAEKAVKNSVPFLNMEMDLGLEGLRHHKQGLRPVSFFKKYTISLKD